VGNVKKAAAALVFAAVIGPQAILQQAGAQTVENYRPPVSAVEVPLAEPMPPGFGVQATDVDGPVFTDAHGRTLYIWPFRFMQIGEAGDRKDKPSNCTDTKFTETSGYMSIYTGGMTLPDLDIRTSCTEAWPPVLAPANAQPVGKWSVSTGPDGRKQWAYDGMPLYTSALDKQPGQVNGGMRRPLQDGEVPPFRVPVGPSAFHPPAFQVKTITTGRILMNSGGLVVYTSSADRPNVSNCRNECLEEWAPVLASETARAQGEWAVIEREAGVKQWTFRTQPVYTYVPDRRRNIVGARGTSLIGNDVPGWQPVYTQKWPDPPAEFTVQDGYIGQVLADKNGMALYTYLCADDALDSQSCDHPSQTQAYRHAICGRGDPALCNQLFPYARAPKDAKTSGFIWGTAWIDPQTGRTAKPDAPGAIHVWTFRERPLFTHSRDKKPGDTNGDAWGEEGGLRNGFKAFWIRDDFFGLAS